MASTQVLLLQLLLVSLASASRHYGGTVAFTYKGRNPDGTLQSASKLPADIQWAFDPDGDRVRCRYGNIRSVECSTCHQPPGFYIDQDSCTLYYQSARNNRRKVFGFEMVVEDFPHENVILNYSDGSTIPQATNMTNIRTTYLNTTTAPLSKLPLQFSVFVDPPIPSCQEGNYLPKFVAPTPRNGAHIQAEVNKEVDIRVKAQVSRRARSRIFHSEMRCVLVDVGKEQIKTNVICKESTMTVEVEKSSFAGLHEEHLRLIDPSNIVCSLQTHSNSTHVIGVIPLNACGTEIEEDEENLIFKNEITTFDITQNTITRHHLLKVQFYCQYPKRGNVTLGFTAHRKNVTVWDKGFGTFTYNFEFYPNDQYQTRIDPILYPLEYDLGNRMYIQIFAETLVNNTDLFVESCRATPYDNPNSRPNYTIIENGCIVDSTIQTYSTVNERQFRFSMEAFKFIGLHDQVYISCAVMMCEAGNPDTRCSQGCVNTTWSNNRRGKREIVTQTLMHRISQGPLRLKRSAERTESPVMNLNLNLVFIAGCLLAAVSAVVMYKAKVSRVKYQPLPAFEN
ncbi:hypothetical protein D5F01_LYC04398 [Larimichthys crocea]|uniref:ZP domain-containing protein n=1 Tax=Larimichthys crocea TaxID=215358 RepID=A0A6G0J2C5_LARCR|nr:hypothetical protein D5F01_LYC04398 [Larimichthys crocea]